MKKIAKVGFALLATGLLAACATKSKSVMVWIALQQNSASEIHKLTN